MFALRCLILVIGALALAVPATAKDEWLQVRSKNFHLIGNASEKNIRKAATKLEQFRETFRQLFGGTKLSAPIPTTVLVFKSDSSYKPFKPKRADGKIDNFIAGYFQPGEDVNYITLSTEGDEAATYGTIFHEYVHFIVNTNFGKSDVPPWFNEGLAEYYQTFEIEDDQKVKLGLLQNEHLQLLAQNKMMPLDQLFKIDNYSLHQTGNHSRSVFYAQSWALMHYLVQGGKHESLGKFLNAVFKGTKPEAAFQAAFQSTYAEMEKSLQKYISKSSFQYQIFAFKNKLLFDTDMTVTPLAEADVNAYLGDLLYHTNREDDAVPYLETALRLQPDSGLANTALAMVKIEQRKYQEAKPYLEKAIAANPKNHLALYRQAYLLSREGRDEFGFVSAFPAESVEKMRDLLKKAIAANPAFTESYELLAFISLVNNDQLDEAANLLKQALVYQPGNQRYLVRIAELYARRENFTEARKLAEKILATADEDQVRESARRVLETVAQFEKFAEQNAAVRQMVENARKNNSGPPVLNRSGNSGNQLSPEEIERLRAEADIRSINEALIKIEPGRSRVLGWIQKIDCRKGIVYTIKTDTETFTLTSKDFQGLEMQAYRPDIGNLQVGCGEDISATRAVVTYKPLENKTTGVRGELTAIEFVPKNFRFIDLTAEPAQQPPAIVASQGEPPPQNVVIIEGGPPSQTDFEAKRRELMLQSIRDNLRKPGAGEKREFGFVQKSECTSKGMFFTLKTSVGSIRLSSSAERRPFVGGFTPEIEGLKIGCNMKDVDVPVVFIYTDAPNSKQKTVGELISLEFVPRSFTM